MGLDMYIDRCKKPEVINGERIYKEREEMCYWRKFYDLLDFMKYGESDYGKDVRLSKNDVENILNYVIHHKDYFGGFDSVPDICKLLDEYDALKEEGYTICFNANW